LKVVVLPNCATKLWFWSFRAVKVVPSYEVRTKVEPSAPLPAPAVPTIASASIATHADAIVLLIVLLLWVTDTRRPS
jgi:hypothetical protein